MSNENGNKKQNNNVPGSSKDGATIENDYKLGDDKKENENKESGKKNIKSNGKRNGNININSPDDSELNQTSRIRKVDAFIYMRVPPDGGYAWIVLLTSFLSIVCIDGMRLSIGRVLPFMDRDLGLKNDAALIASLQIGFFYFCGPFACALIHKIGYRAVTAIGASISIVATLWTSFANNHISLFISFGILAGIGYGTVSIATHIIIGFYFEKYRPIATGLSSAGTGFGVLICSPLYNFVAVNYGWQIALRCHSIFALTVLLLSLSYREVKPIMIGQYIERKNEEDDETYTSADSLEISTTNFQNYVSVNSDTAVSITNVSQTNLYKQISVSKSNYQQNQNLSNKNKYEIFLSQCCKRKHRQSIIKKNSELAIILSVNPLERKDIFYAGKPQYPEGRNQILPENSYLPINKVRSVHYTMSVTKPLRKDKQDTEAKYSFCKKFSHIFKLLIDPELLRTKEFQYLLLSSFLFTFGSNVPYIYLTEHVNIPIVYANYLLSAIGFSNVIFRISGGFIVYYIKTNPIYLSGIPMTISGIFTIIIGFFGRDIIWFQFIYCITLGSGFALSTSLKSIIYVQILGLDKLTNATGLNALAMGIASFMGTNFAGIMKSFTGKTNYAFCVAGIALLSGGLLCVSLPTIFKRKSDVKKSTNN